MERWLKRKAPDDANNVGNSQQQDANVTFHPIPSAPKDINWEEEIQFDPGKRKEISAYHPNLRETVRRKYLVNGPCQPRTLNFPSIRIGDKNRRFNPEWFDEFGNWLEYSESTNRAYCFVCFLFRDPTKKEAGYKSFVLDGWNSWHNKERLKEVVLAAFTILLRRNVKICYTKHNTLMLLFISSWRLLKMHILFDLMVQLILPDCCSSKDCLFEDMMSQIHLIIEGITGKFMIA